MTRAPRSQRLSELLLEREGELAVLAQCLRDAGAGVGGVVFLAAPAGGGKSSLLAAAREVARESRMRILTAAGTKLEREFPFGLAMQLFGPLSPSADQLGEPHSAIHDLFQATHSLIPHSEDAQAEGLAILIDDLHWADRLSLRFLAYVVERAPGLPIAIVVSARPGEPSADPQALATLRSAAAGRLLAPAPLSEDGVAHVVRRRFPRADAELCAACAWVSGGNPFLLTELVSVLTGGEQALGAAPARSIEEVVPDAVREAVATRLDSMPPAARAVAEAVAVLGDGASVQRVARLAELDSGAVLLAADELAAMQVLAPAVPLSFVQPMVGSAVWASLGPLQRAHAHLRAARILAEQHVGPDLIAEHLLQSPPDDDPAAAAVLREAAEAALERHEPEHAIRLLERALAEHPEQALHAELRAAVAHACVIADDLERAIETCDAALDGAGDEPPLARELIACARAYALYEQGRLTDAEAAASAALEDRPRRPRGYAQSAMAVLARCHIERGRLEQAESMLAEIERQGSRDCVRRASVLDVRSQLRLAQHRPQDALRDAMHAGAALEEQCPNASPGAIAWRSSAALAHLALGERERARELVEHELEHVRRIGVTRIVIRDLRILGLASSGQRGGIEKLAEAVASGGSCPSRLEHIRALIDYGAALRRAGRRAEAREPLRLGLDLSHRAGAFVLESRARTELIAAGARPRRPLVSGVQSLTVSQLRVAELAAAGLTTRQIAGALFVTPKTIEYHLRQVYLKLDVGSREELAQEFSPSPAAVPRGA